MFRSVLAICIRNLPTADLFTTDLLTTDLLTTDSLTTKEEPDHAPFHAQLDARRAD